MSATSPLRAVLLNAVTAGTSAAIDCSALLTLTIYLKGSGTTTGGTVLVEEADYDPNSEATFSGTWAVVQSMDPNDVTTSGSTKQKAYHVTAPSAWKMVRARVSSAVTGGGNVSLTLIGNAGD